MMDAAFVLRNGGRVFGLNVPLRPGRGRLSGRPASEGEVLTSSVQRKSRGTSPSAGGKGERGRKCTFSCGRLFLPQEGKGPLRDTPASAGNGMRRYPERRRPGGGAHAAERAEKTCRCPASGKIRDGFSRKIRLRGLFMTADALYTASEALSLRPAAGPGARKRNLSPAGKGHMQDEEYG